MKKWVQLDRAFTRAVGSLTKEAILIGVVLVTQMASAVPLQHGYEDVQLFPSNEVEGHPSHYEIFVGVFPNRDYFTDNQLMEKKNRLNKDVKDC